MAKSIKKKSKKAIVKKVTGKNTGVKTAGPKKSAAKKVVSKKTVNKKVAKPVAKKATSKKLVKKAVPKKIPHKKAPGNSSVVNRSKKTIPSQSELNKKTAKANDYAAMLEDTNAASSQNENGNQIMNNANEGSSTSADTSMHNPPVPTEKYARPADPYHGNTAIVKRKSNITPSGKKPLWKK